MIIFLCGVVFCVIRYSFNMRKDFSITLYSILWNRYLARRREILINCLFQQRFYFALVLYVCFVDRCLSFCTFSFGHCVVCSSSLYGFWLPLWYLQTLLNFLFIDLKWLILRYLSSSCSTSESSLCHLLTLRAWCSLVVVGSYIDINYNQIAKDNDLKYW
jgi:hypothetical protein